MLWCAACTGAPPLRLVQEGGVVTIDVQTLGEYQTTIRRIRLTEHREDRVVWEVVATSGTPQIGTLTLKGGKNPTAVANVQSGQYRVLTPQGADSFLLKGGTQYLIEMWGDRSDGTPASGEFEFVNAEGGA